MQLTSEDDVDDLLNRDDVRVVAIGSTLYTISRCRSIVVVLVVVVVVVEGHMNSYLIFQSIQDEDDSVQDNPAQISARKYVIELASSYSRCRRCR